MHKTSAWPLALVYVGLIVYASLYPFTEWRYQGIVSWAFMWAGWPKYWTGFDVVSNVLGYGPFGFLLALSALRTERGRWAVVGATAAAALLSFSMESLQGFLPSPHRLTSALLVLALGVYLSLLNQMPTNPYFAQTLSAWEQGRFIRFHGLAQWLGWVWPYAALAYVMRRILVREPKTRISV